MRFIVGEDFPGAVQDGDNVWHIYVSFIEELCLLAHNHGPLIIRGGTIELRAGKLVQADSSIEDLADYDRDR